MQNKVAGSCGNSGSRICPAAQPLAESTKAYRDPLLRSRGSTHSAGPEITTQSGQLTALPETPLSAQHHPGTGHDETHGLHCLHSPNPQPRRPGSANSRADLRTRVLSGRQADTHHLLASEVSRTRHACLWEQGEKGTQNLSVSATENQKVPEESKMSGSRESPRDF